MPDIAIYDFEQARTAWLDIFHPSFIYPPFSRGRALSNLAADSSAAAGSESTASEPARRDGGTRPPMGSC